MANILVVDDDRLFAQLMMKALMKAGHDAVVAEDGIEAMAALAQRQFTCVVCDLIMPNQEGLETIKLMRAACPTLAIIAISGGMPSGNSSNLNILDVAVDFGANAALRKPFQLSALVTSVNEVLRNCDQKKLSA
jgi:DNA-binding response OmpR family regulator